MFELMKMMFRCPMLCYEEVLLTRVVAEKDDVLI